MEKGIFTMQQQEMEARLPLYKGGNKLEAARYSIEDMEGIATSTVALLNGLQAAAKEAERLTAALISYKPASIADQWVEQWGEAVTKKTAAKMLGVSVPYVTKLIDAGKLQVSADNRILVRQACAWMHSKNPDKKPARKGSPPPHMRFRA